MEKKIIWWMNISECSYFKENSELAFAALELFVEHEKTCANAEKVLKTKIKKLIADYELEKAHKK
jgi:hypothetical protein